MIVLKFKINFQEELTATLDDNSSDVKCDVVELEKLLDKYSQVLHPCHYLITAIKRYLLYGYAGSPGANPGPELLTKKLSFAMDILKQYDIVSPGLTKERGLTLFEVNVLSDKFLTYLLESF